MGRMVFILFQVALRDFSRNNGPYVAAGIAYWTLFSLFPLALAAISVLGFVYHHPDQQARIVEGTLRLVPVSREYVAGLVEGVLRDRGAVGVLGVLGLLWTGTTVFSAVRKGINHAWGIGKPHYFLLERSLDLAMLVSVTAIGCCVFIATAPGVGGAVGSHIPDWLARGLVGSLLIHALLLAITFGVLMVLYRYVPNTHVEWRDVWLGAAVGAVLFQGMGTSFTSLVAHFGSFNLVYGSLGALMAVLLWAYLSAMAVTWGAQVACTYSRAFGSRATTDRLPELASPTGEIRGALATIAGWLVPGKRDRL